MKDFQYYISEIDDDVAKMLTRKTLMAKEMEFGLFVVSKSGEDVARCAAIINKKFQAQKQPGAGFIGFFAAVEGCEQEVTEMIGLAENWLKKRGVSKIIAPANGGAPNSMGFMVTGFDEDPMFPFSWTPPYYQGYIERLKYQPAYPLCSLVTPIAKIPALLNLLARVSSLNKATKPTFPLNVRKSGVKSGIAKQNPTGLPSTSAIRICCGARIVFIGPKNSFVSAWLILANSHSCTKVSLSISVTVSMSLSHFFFETGLITAAS